MKRNRVTGIVYRIFTTGRKRFPIYFNVRDRLFRFIFENDRKALLELYNALNGTNYQDPADLKIMTIKNVIYMSMKNDLAFAIAGVLNLYEQQSSFNPNMPVRFFIYLGQEFQKVIAENGMERIYGTRLIKLPTPKCVVFYNGKQEEPENQILKLSDAFEHTEQYPDVELKVRMININYGHNAELMEKCHRLWEYSFFVDQINKGTLSGLAMRTAVNNAVDYCIQNNILSDILEESRMEVVGMLLNEFNEQRYKKFIREEAREEGIAEGIARGIAQGTAKGIAQGMEKGIAQGMEKGIAQGMEKGIAQGQSRVNLLYQKLREDGRIDDVMQAIDNCDHLEQLLKEYKL